jgi:hypothetical protein
MKIRRQRNANKRLAVRQAGHDTRKSAGSVNPKAFTRPGSQNPHKQG